MAEEKCLDALLETFSKSQLDFVTVRMHGARTDKEAAEAIGISPDRVYHWPNKADVDEAVRLAKLDGVTVAREKLKRLASKAVDKLESAIDKDEPALSAIFGVLDRVGLPEVKRQEVGGPGGGPLKVEFINDWRGAPHEPD